MIISRSSALSINVLLIFNIHDLNGVLFSNVTFFSALSFSFAAAAKRYIVPFTIYMHDYNNTNLVLTFKF